MSKLSEDSDTLRILETPLADDTDATGEKVGRRIGLNSVYMAVRTVLIMFVSLYTSRLALEVLGETDYGIYSLVAGFVIFFGFLNISMESSILRFLMYEKGRGNTNSLQRMFNVAMIAQFCIICVVLLAGETIGLWWVNNRLNIPPERMEATNWVFQLSLLTLCFNIVKVPYNAMIIAFEKLNFYAFFSMGEVMLRLVCILTLLLLHDHLLIIYSAQFLAVTIVVVTTYKIYCCHSHCYGHVCHFRFLWDARRFRDIIFFSGWNTLGCMASMAALQGLSLILNHFFGVTVNSAFGLAIMVQHATFAILASFQTAFSPKLVALYAQGCIKHLRSFIDKLGKYSFYLSAALLVPLCLNIDIVLQIWLGDQVPKYTGIFCLFVIVGNGIDCIAAPGRVCNQATGKVKNFNIIWSILLISNLPLSWLCIKLTGWAPTACVVRVAITGLIYLFVAWMMHVQIHFGFWRYLLVSMLRPLFVFSIAFTPAFFLHTVTEPGLLNAIGNSALFWTLFGIGIYIFDLTAKERGKVIGKFNQGLRALQRN